MLATSKHQVFFLQVDLVYRQIWFHRCSHELSKHVSFLNVILHYLEKQVVKSQHDKVSLSVSLFPVCSFSVEFHLSHIISRVSV